MTTTRTASYPPAEPTAAQVAWVEWNRACAAAHDEYEQATANARLIFETEYSEIHKRGGAGVRSAMATALERYERACAPAARAREAALDEADRRWTQGWRDWGGEAPEPKSARQQKKEAHRG